MVAEPPIEENHEEPPQPGELGDESQTTREDNHGVSEPVDDEETEDEEQEENGSITAQDAEDPLPQVGEGVDSAPGQDVTDANESDEGEDSGNEDSIASAKEETHSSGYNLRKRKEINYRDARKYKTTATILYQYGKVPKTKKEDLMASLTKKRQ